MAKKKSESQFDFAGFQAKLVSQFSGLDPKDPSLWPVLPRVLLYVVTSIVVAVLLWFAVIKDYEAELESERNTEITLRADYKEKLIKAVSLDALKKQREQVQQYVIQLEKQLPSKAEMAALLSDINQAGLGRSLQFELFRPGQLIAKDYYAELPISLKVMGKYHDIGAFASDVAHLSRIVTLNDLSVTSNSKDPTSLTLEGTARTFRYLDNEEIQAQRKAAASKPGGATK
jgi:type IV pilus assembly protein PilO